MMRSERFRAAFGLGHRDPIPAGEFRLVQLRDDWWSPNTFIGGRAWCDARLRDCSACGGRCCGCRHTERRPSWPTR